MNEFAKQLAPDTVRIERDLPGPVERIWAFLTEGDKRAKWFCGGHMTPRVGGDFELVFHNNTLTENDDPPPSQHAQYGEQVRMRGRITLWEPNHALAFTWEETDSEDSEVRFDLTERGDRVRLVITHSRLKDRQELIDVCSGWHAHLDVLVATLEDRQPEGFWRSHARLEAEYRDRIR